MRIQSFNQNNYSNKNIMFKQNFKIWVNGLNCNYGCLCEESSKALESQVAKVLGRHGIDFHPQRNAIIQKLDSEGSTLIVMDARTTDRFLSAPTDKETEKLITEVQQDKSLSWAQTYWRDICPPNAPN